MKFLPYCLRISGCLTFLLNLLFAQPNAKNVSQLKIMPIPQEIKQSGEKFHLAADFSLVMNGKGHPRLYRAVTRFLRRLSDRTGLFFSQDFITQAQPGTTGAFLITCERAGIVKLGEDESYQLNITHDSIHLNAKTDIGAMHGLETLLQLIMSDQQGYYFPTLQINDAPRFPWRGLLIDISRHFMPPEVIKRNLDGMAALKMNVLHWHLVDDQGFRVESKIFPKLHEKGSDGLYYTQQQIREIIQYADDRGIRVMPEFDVPAHATSWLVGYPELGSAPGPYAVERTWGIHDPVLNPANEKVYHFLDKFFGEMAMLFPDEYMHIGGDENNGKHWDANAEIQAFMQKNNIADNHALQSYFNRRVLKILTRHHKKMIGWDEIFHPDLPKNAVIHSWRGQASLVKAAQQGYQAILSNGYYIDLIQPASFHYLNDPAPANSPLTDTQKRNILGGEATMWAEMVSTETIDSRIWPRTAAIAERLWSPQSVNNVEDMYRRLARISFLLEEHGLTHLSNYEMMLRRLTDNRDINALKTLVDIVEPVKIYTRHRQGVKYTATSPLTRVVDAARPESMTARKFAQMVDSLIADPNFANGYQISDMLKNWKHNHRKLLPVIQSSPILRELESLSADMETVAEFGLNAGKYYTSGVRPSEMWIERTLELLEKTKQPRGQVELMIVDPVIKMVKAVAGEKEKMEVGSEK